MNEYSSQQAVILSEIIRDIAEVVFAYVFVGPLISGKMNIQLLVPGLLVSLFLWYFSLIMPKFYD